MKEIYQQLIKSIGEDINREGLRETPHRASEAFKFLTRGYTQNLDDIINNALFKAESDGMVVVKKIEMFSLCEHHMLPFFGKCHIGYLPKDKVLGVSKLARIVNYFSQRLQIQERLTSEIANCIQAVTDARGVAVIVEAKHLCMMMRGVEKQLSCMTTSVMLGELKEDEKSRLEFLNLIR